MNNSQAQRFLINQLQTFAAIKGLKGTAVVAVVTRGESAQRLTPDIIILGEVALSDNDAEFSTLATALQKFAQVVRTHKPTGNGGHIDGESKWRGGDYYLVGDGSISPVRQVFIAFSGGTEDDDCGVIDAAVAQLRLMMKIDTWRLDSSSWLFVVGLG